MPKTKLSTILLNPGMDGFNEILVPDDRDEVFLCYETLSNSFSDDDEKSLAIETLHLLVKSYPQISDLYALLIIGYRGLEMNNKAIRILRRTCIRFQSNLTLRLLSSLYGKLKQTQPIDFQPKTLTQRLMQDLTRAQEVLGQNSIDLALELIEEMLRQGEYYEQIGHWAIGEALYMLARVTGLDPIDELNICKILDEDL